MDGAFPSQRGQDFGENGRRGGGRGGGNSGFRGTAENAKTKMCTRWQSGECRFGDRCNFAHGDHELRSLPPREEGGGRGFGGGRGRGGYGYGGRGRGRGDYGYGGYQQGGYQGGHDGGYGGGYGGPRGEDQNVLAQQQGYPTPGPNGWVMYRTPETGEPYYHNHKTNQTQWDRPAEWPAGPQ